MQWVPSVHLCSCEQCCSNGWFFKITLFLHMIKQLTIPVRDQNKTNIYIYTLDFLELLKSKVYKVWSCTTEDDPVVEVASK